MTRSVLFPLLTAFLWTAACSSDESLPGGATGGAAGVGGGATTGGTAGTGGAAAGGAGAGGTFAGATGSGGVQSGGAGGSTSAGSSAGGAGGSGGTSGGSGGAGGTSGSGGTGQSGVQVYILFGQSNMWGEPYPQPQDVTEDPNVEVLTRITCGSHGKNEWVTAVPPLHECVGQFGDASGGPGGGDYSGPGVGPGDYFARTVAEAFPNDTILLIPNAIPGVAISQFAVGSATYNDMIARAEMGKERGPIKGILFHQGESDCGSAAWPNAVKTIVDAMRTTLGTGDIPFLAGEIPQTSQCQGHNARVAELPGIIENAHVISSASLGITDQYHFGLADQRTFGTRYGEKMLELLP